MVETQTPISSNDPWDNILKLTKSAQENGTDPLLWANGLSSSLISAGVSLPSIELTGILVSHICRESNVPILWKFLDQALLLNMVPPFLVLALFSTRVVPSRHSQPAAYRLYLELLKQHGFNTKTFINSPSYPEVMKSVDSHLHLSDKFGAQASDPGILLVELLLSLVWQLLDALLDDENLLEHTPEKKSVWAVESQDARYDEERTARHKFLQTTNTAVSIELLGKFLQDDLTSRVLYLIRLNMPAHWTCFTAHLRVLGERSLELQKSNVKPEDLLKLASDTRLAKDPPVGKVKSVRGVMSLGLPISLWLPLDLVLEDAVDGHEVAATSAVETVTSLIKVLKAISETTWHDTFVDLWAAALRLVERDSIEGSIPNLDTRLSMLLSITTLVVADLIEEQEEGESSSSASNLREDLASSLQTLNKHHQGLLTPCHAVIDAANQAAIKAIMFLSGVERLSSKDMSADFSGNMLHLIVEACIARKLLDAWEAYNWPGYVPRSMREDQAPTVPSQEPGWSLFMQGEASFDSLMKKALISSPASSLPELERVFNMALKGSADEKISACTILCGASLVRGWNIQEHIVAFITRLLSPQVPADYSGGESHLIAFAPMLNVLITGIESAERVQIFSLHGMVPQLAASLMPICEVFGSCMPDVSWTLTTGESVSAHAVFSNAFTLLLKLWRLDYPPPERGPGNIPVVGSQVTPEHLLHVRNSHLLSDSFQIDRNKRRLFIVASSSSLQPIVMDSFPRLKVWYRQHQACKASPLPGLHPGTPVQQTVYELLSMMFNSSRPARLKLPAWDILEVVPYAVDAALTACSHGRLTHQVLVAGLISLLEFLPVSLAACISYVSAELTRCVLKPVYISEAKWNIPAANISYIETRMKRIIAASGVELPSFSCGAHTTIPLALVAFVVLTIVNEKDAGPHCFLNLAPALELIAARCPWPCMPIVASLLTKKKRWSDFLAFASSLMVFPQNKDAVVRLLESCFVTALGRNSVAPASIRGGVCALLGKWPASQISGEISPVAPGILYLRVYRSIKDTLFIAEEMVSLLIRSVRGFAPNVGQVSPEKKNELLANAMTNVNLVASLAASLLWLSGGSGLVQVLIQETLPSWFLTVHGESEQNKDSLSMLEGYTLAYFAVLSSALAWGIDSHSSASKRCPEILGTHLEFLASALDGKISLGCKRGTWHAYVSGFFNLMVGCTPNWAREADADVLKRLSKTLVRLNETSSAQSLLGFGGVATMGAAAEFIINQFKPAE